MHRSNCCIRPDVAILFVQLKKDETVQCLKSGLFTWPAIFLEKQKSLLIKTRDPKISYGCGDHHNLCMLTGFYLFFHLNHMTFPLADVFDELILLYVFSFSPKSVSSHHQTNTHQAGILHSPNQISSKQILNPGQD